LAVKRDAAVQEREMTVPKIGIEGCDLVPVSANRDSRGCLYEIYRQSWPHAFPTVQWNACASNRGVVRGAHVHVDYDEFYTLPRGRVLIGLADIRTASPTFRKSAQFEWSSQDGFAVVVPRGVAHVVLFEDDSVLAFGLSDYWKAEYDVVGCQWDDPDLGFDWPKRTVIRSERDAASGNYAAMLQDYEKRSRAWQETRRLATCCA
jgi:dTDP-4-dehydrorhamnose 3,5-epimerase